MGKAIISWELFDKILLMHIVDRKTIREIAKELSLKEGTISDKFRSRKLVHPIVANAYCMKAGPNHRICCCCGKVMLLDKFWKTARYCKKCYAVKNYKKDPVKTQNTRLLYKYGITNEQRMQMFDEQKGCCKACPAGLDITTGAAGYAVDHDHETGEVRGILCSACNKALGLLQECPDRFKYLIKYLE